MSEDEIARLRLFAAIEGGSEFWSHEIANNGALKVLAAIEGGFYPNKDRKSTRLNSSHT